MKKARIRRPGTISHINSICKFRNYFPGFLPRQSANFQQNIHCTCFQEAKKRGLIYAIDTVELRDAHPNTAVIETWDAGGKKLELQACSVGGGRILVNKVDGIDVSFDGMFNTLVIRNQDENGAVAAVTSVLNQLRINVANMSLCRHKRGGDALMVIETDQHIKPHQVAFLSELTGILSVTYYDKEDDDDVSGFDEGNL